MKLFIWESGGISAAYHDDGTLVVLAETVEQAREIVRANKVHNGERSKRFSEIYALYREGKIDGNEQLRLNAEIGGEYGITWDGSDRALDREPDSVMELDVPKVVAFNGGGYD